MLIPAAFSETMMDIAAFFAPELIKAYPDAKFILTSRDPDAWMRSVENTILKAEMMSYGFPVWYMKQIDTYTYEMTRLTSCLGRFLWKRTKDDPVDLHSRERAIKGYLE